MDIDDLFYMDIKFLYANSEIVHYYISKQPGNPFLIFPTQLILLPLMYTVALFELNILSEACPLSVNMLLYLLFTILILLFSLGLSYFQFNISYYVGITSFDSEAIIYGSFLCNYTLILYILYIILPDWIYVVFSWINFRVLYWILLSNIVIYFVWNAITKYRGNVHFSTYDIAIISELALFIMFKHPLYFVILNPTSKQLYFSFIVGIIWVLFTEMQTVYGSRFFLPSRWRSKIYEYRRRIIEDFELKALDEDFWPEWDFWMKKLHLPSLYTGDRSLKKIEGENCYQMYMKTQDGKKLHYFWLLYMFEQNFIQLGYLQNIDVYDD